MSGKSSFGRLFGLQTSSAYVLSHLSYGHVVGSLEATSHRNLPKPCDVEFPTERGEEALGGDLGNSGKEGKTLEVPAVLAKVSRGSECIVIMIALAGATCLHPVSCRSLPVGPYFLLGSLKATIDF